MSDIENPPAGEFEYPDGSTPALDADGKPILEDRSEDFPEEAAVAEVVEGRPARRLGPPNGLSAPYGLMAKRAARRLGYEESETAPVAPDTEEERAAALALAAEFGYTESDLVDSDGNPLDVAGIHASLAVEGGQDPDGEAVDGAETPEGEGADTGTPEGDESAQDEAPEGEADDAEPTEEESTEEESTEEEPADEGYDPSAHTVADVQAYLAENPDQSTYVLARERDGKARVSLIGA